MLCTHVVALATLALCVAEDNNKRATRNPGLLHLAHAGHSVGSYLAPEGSAGAGAGAGGPQIVIYGGHPQVTTRVVSKDSLEELDEDIRQYQQHQPQPVRYVPNSSLRHYFDSGRPSLDLPGFKDAPASSQYTGYDFPKVTGSTPLAFSYPRTYGHFNVGPVLYNPQAHAPFTGLAGYAGHSVHSVRPSPTPQYSPSPTPSHYSQLQNTATPATANYATPTAYPATPSATPLTHPLSSPVILPARVPLHHPLQSPVSHFSHGLNYHNPLGQGPVFLPVQAFGPHLNLYRNQGHSQYSPHGDSDGRYNKNEQTSDEEERGYYGGSQGRRPMEYQQREFGDEGAYSGENSDYQKSYGKYESNESLPKSAATPSYQTYPSEDKGSLEDSSREVSSGEKSSPFKYSFGDSDQHAKVRAAPLADGGGKVATSYQSVTFETHHPVPLHYPKKPH